MRIFLMATLISGCFILTACSEQPVPDAEKQSMQAAVQSESDSLASNLVVDPVCGMELDKTKVTLTADFQGTTYYFCNESEKIAFEKDPERFLASE